MPYQFIMDNNNLNPNLTPNGRPPRKQLAPRDMMIVAIAILVITRIDFANINSFHILILFLMFLMLMLRWANMRKEAVRKNAMERYKSQFEEEEAAKRFADQLAAEAAAKAEPVAAENISVDGKAIPTAEVSEPEAPAEEKSEE